MILLKASSDASRTPISSFAPSDPTDLPALNGQESYSRKYSSEYCGEGIFRSDIRRAIWDEGVISRTKL
jgi:hypothetical protein